MRVSVHAISMLYELRALRSRLQEMIAEPDIFRTEDTQRELVWMEHLVLMLLNKIERTGEYIAALEREVQAAGPPEEAGVGPDHERSWHDDHG